MSNPFKVGQLVEVTKSSFGVAVGARGRVHKIENHEVLILQLKDNYTAYHVTWLKPAKDSRLFPGKITKMDGSA